ncbi:hypothetical protein MW887_008334, partial [Aspergillus wentii]
YLNSTSNECYESFMKKKRLQPESIPLNHGATGHWIGNKDAKDVVVYYHGGAFALPITPEHFEFFYRIIQRLNANGRDVAFFFVEYTLTPRSLYPTQLRQSVEALRYILTETKRSPTNVLVGGDSAGGNLALAVLLHLSHPHPEIEPVEVSEPLRAVLGIAPWVNYQCRGPSVERNKYKDIIDTVFLNKYSTDYLNGSTVGDNWSEPSRAPLEWWEGAKVQQSLIVAGSDEILLSGIEEFANKFKSVVPNTTYIVGHGDTHDDLFYDARFDGEQAKAVESWLTAQL